MTNSRFLNRKRLTIIICFLFPIPFAATGMWMSWRLVTVLTEHSQMQNWVESTAHISRVEIVDGDSRHGTQETKADYEYQYGGHRYSGSRVGLHPGSDNVGEFQGRVYRELRGHFKSGEPFRCFVNSQQPTQSILYRELRWEMILFYTAFVVMFGGFGFGFLAVVLYSLLNPSRPAISFV